MPGKLSKKDSDPAGAVKKRVLTAMEIPEDLSCKAPILTLTGPHRAVIENYKNILYYQQERLIVLTCLGKIILEGKNLEIIRYDNLEMEVQGCIKSLCFENHYK